MHNDIFYFLRGPWSSWNLCFFKRSRNLKHQSKAENLHCISLITVLLLSCFRASRSSRSTWISRPAGCFCFFYWDAPVHLRIHKYGLISNHLIRSRRDTEHVFDVFPAGRNRVVGSPGPPGPPGPPGIPGTFSGSLEDISTRIIAYIQRESFSTAVQFPLNGVTLKRVVEFQVQVPVSVLGFRVLQVHLVLPAPGLWLLMPSSLCSRVSTRISKYAVVQNCGSTRWNGLSLCDLGEDVRRYLSGPPGPQGPPGPPGTSVGISASYSVDEIATYVFNIMNSEHALNKTAESVKGKLESNLPIFFRSRDC